MSIEVILDKASLPSELVQLLSLTTKSIRWLLAGNLSGIWNTVIFVCDGVPIDCIDGFTFGVSAKMVGVLIISSKFETITFVDSVCSIATVLSFVCQKPHYCVQLITVLFYFSFCFLLQDRLFARLFLFEGVCIRRDIFILLLQIIWYR